jgi:hypothetical protein
MATLMQASNQWASRPDDERFVNLNDMFDHFQTLRSISREVVVSTRKIQVIPHEDNKGLEIQGPSGVGYTPSHWSFGQLAQLAEAPAGYLRTMPAPIVADCLNYGLQYKRDIEDVGLLLSKNGSSNLRAATGPNYGRIWNEDILRSMIQTVGDGINGNWKVPGEFGKRVVVTKANTTLFAGDRDFFVFLADEDHKIEIPNRRQGAPGLLSRGFFCWNSEVGSRTFGLATFLFDYVCCNRIVWGATEYKELKIRHTASAPDRFLEEIQPALLSYSNGSSKTVVDAVKAAQAARLDDVDAFLSKRFGKRVVGSIKAAHLLEEGRPIETLWDATTGITAYAKGIAFQDDRVDVERIAGDIMQLAA